MVERILLDVTRGIDAGIISVRFHNALAGHAEAVARTVGLEDVILSGGCFQNAVLVRLTRQRLVAAGFQVFTHRSVPTNDGGLALGQLLVAAALQRSSSCA